MVQPQIPFAILDPSRLFDPKGDEPLASTDVPYAAWSGPFRPVSGDIYQSKTWAIW